MIALIVLLVLGAALAVAWELNKQFPLPEFTWKKFLKQNLFAIVINLIVGVILIISRDDLSLIYPITKLSIAIVGFAGGMLWQGIVDSVTKDKKTAIGVNKK